MPPIRLVAGLGNPGPRATRATRHNAGFWFVDALASQARRGVRDRGASSTAHVAKADGDLRLLKPATYMNLSGRSVAGAGALLRASRPSEILVVHDELDLLPGEAKMKFGGGIAGHNGLRDIAAQLGTPDFWRLRIGIGHPRDSAIPQQDVADYVLAPPSRGRARGDRRRDRPGARRLARDRRRRLRARDAACCTRGTEKP